MKYKITVEAEGDVTGLTLENDDLGYLLYLMVRVLHPARGEFPLAVATNYWFGWEAAQYLDFWPGYKDALDKFSEGADKIERGWDDHDKKIKDSDL